MPTSRGPFPVYDNFAFEAVMEENAWAENGLGLSPTKLHSLGLPGQPQPRPCNTENRRKANLPSKGQLPAPHFPLLHAPTPTKHLSLGTKGNLPSRSPPPLHAVIHVEMPPFLCHSSFYTLLGGHPCSRPKTVALGAVWGN